MFSAEAKWIRQSGTLGGRSPAWYFRKSFFCPDPAIPERLLIAAAGFYEAYLNGKKIGDHVLDPVVTQYDRRVRFVSHDLTGLLRQGENVIGVIMGNGWYNCQVENAWFFERASWRDYPKFLLQIGDNAAPLVVSDASWKCATGPILSDELRQGEVYDARREIAGWAEVGLDETHWSSAVRIAAPGGLLQEQTMPACKVMATLPPCQQTGVGSDVVYNFGQNLSGWCRIRVRGTAGAQITIRYAERLQEDGRVDQTHIAKHHTVAVEKGEFQTDRYLLRGGGEEIWEPRFVYHGFQYAQVSVEGNASVEGIEARFVHTAFRMTGQIACSHPLLTRLQDCTVRSYKGNFVGIPTDCPHREKNGWTGDAQLAVETGLFQFSAAEAYNQWIDSFADAQRPSGQLPGIVPSCGWGFNWGSGPAWDSAFLIIPWNVYLYTGDRTSIDTHYEAMKRYVDYCSSMAEGDVVSFGLGDWAHHDRSLIVDPALTSTAYYYADCRLLAHFAWMRGNEADKRSYTTLAERIQVAFHRAFYQGGGIYAKGEQTALACALYHGLVPESERQAVLQKLVAQVRKDRCKAEFGILGAKYIPRVLADFGYAELACEILTQPEFPGWGHWLQQGATTLWESWHGESSLNHIMFGDLSAWMYQYLAGIAPDPAQPGFRHFTLQPRFIRQLDWVRAEHQSPQGLIRSGWQREGDRIAYECEVPQHACATFRHPDGTSRILAAGRHRFSCQPELLLQTTT